MAHLRWQRPANGSDVLAIAQIRWHRTARPPSPGSNCMDLQAMHLEWPGDVAQYRVVAKQICIPRAGIVFGLGHSRRDGMMRGDEKVKLPPLPRDGFAPSGHALPDLRPHRRAPARQSQRSPDRALPAGTPGSARPPFRIAGPRRPRTPCEAYGVMLGIHLSNLDVAPYTGPGSRPLPAAEQAYLAQYAAAGYAVRRPVQRAADRA